MAKKEYYLTVHGHFYQPPRENPWLEIIELQDSALPFHDWNDRISYECYTPNSVSRIVDHNSQILDIVNNYSLISFNIGPTLLSWLEVNSPKTYGRILEADKESLEMFSGHGNALAQVYNHMIMPLANERDKYTQTIWGIRDFEHRFNRKPEGIWLAETAVDDTSLRVLVDCGIKFTILSPYQAEKVRPLNSNDEEETKWFDVSWGNIDPGCAYRYFLKDGTDRYIDLFFYDGSISKSVAFENLLYNGDKFINRLRDGISTARDYDQLVHISTDGESYGHHTKFGDMALSYALKKRSKQVGFKITNYGEYLEKNAPKYEVEIKENSSWSCCHGVGRWKDDCGCSTGAQAGWNQKWRKPLRNALNWLRDELIIIYEKQASKYLKDSWKARNKYIDVIIDRNKSTILSFCKHESSKVLSEHEIVEVVKLLEMQRQAMLMFTSCGWFFADISGIETTQLLKYAARAMQLAEDFTEIDLENQFLCKLEEAQSNISDFGNGKSLYLSFVKPSIVSVKQVVNHWAISSLFEERSSAEAGVYCYDIKSIDYKKIKKLNNTLLIGRLELVSNITLEKHDMIYALMHYGGEDFHCAIRGFSGGGQYKKLKEELVSKFYSRPLTEVIRCLDENFGKDYYTLKDLFIEQRRKIVSILIKDQLERFSSTYKSLYEEGKYPILQLMELGLQIPPEFKIAAEYTLSDTFNAVVRDADDIGNIELLQRAVDISEEAEKLGIVLDKAPAKELYSSYLTQKVIELSENMDLHNLENIIRIISLTKKLKLTIDLTEAQNIYFNSIYNKVPCMISNLANVEFVEPEKKFIGKILELGKELHLNVEQIVTELENFTG